MKLSLIFVCFNVYMFCFSQENFVQDPSFEKCKICETYLTTNWRKYPLKLWNLPNNATSDYFYFNEKNVQDYTNFNGYQKPKTEFGYAGFGCRNRWREYLQTELKEALIKDSLYIISFFVSLANESKKSASNLGACLSNEKVHFNSYGIIDIKPILIDSNQIKDTSNWVQISGKFIAEGNERHLIIGSFGNKKSFKKTKFKKLKKKVDNWAYYYLDDVSVRLYRPDIDSSDSKVTSTFNNISGKSFVLPDILFNSNESILLNTAFHALDSLAGILKSNPEIKIKIEGHTDNSGDAQTNQALSINRAFAIKEYLLNNGIEVSRMDIEGFGDTKPVADNSTLEGQSKNRRVEIKFE